MSVRHKGEELINVDSEVVVVFFSLLEGNDIDYNDR